MKYFLANLGVNLVSIGCIAAAAWLAVEGKEGWGWFLFGAIICSGSVVFKGEKE